MVTDNKVIVAERVELDRYIKEKVDMFTKWMNCEVEDLAFQLVDGFGRVSPWFVMGNCPDPTRAKNTAHHMVNEQWQPYLDGTIRPRHHTHLAMGLRDGDSKTILVDAHDTRRRLIFHELRV